MANGDQPAIPGDIQQLRSEFHEDIGQPRSETRQDIEQFRSEVRHGFDDLKKMLRDFQAEVLKVFARYTQTTDAKLKEAQTSDIGLRQRLTAVEERLLEVEKRLNLPPAA